MRVPDTSRHSFAAVFLAVPAMMLLLVFFAGPFLFLLRLSFCAPPAGHGFYQADTWTTLNYTALFADAYFHQVVLFTLLLALGVTGLVLLIALPLSLFIHSLPSRQKALAVAAIVLPKLASMLVVVYGLQAMLSSAGIVNEVLQAIGLVREPLRLSRNLSGAILGETYLLLPYAVLVLVVGLERIDAALVPAARGLGASPWQAFRRITLPLLTPGLTIAAQLTLAWALGAFIGPLLLGSPDEITLAVEVHRQTIENNHWPRGAATAASLLIGVVLLLTTSGLAIRWLMRRSTP
ncbi:MAG TPA: ABC transporter permease [Gemmataceae bacterium]|nr:ABC transporter permease [Gemmataceae bacterium]